MTTVNVPTNIKQKEADVNQKLQLYGIYEGMSPSTADSLESVVARSAPRRRSVHGSQPLTDAFR